MDTGGLTSGAFLCGGLGCMDGGTFFSAVDGVGGTALYSGDNVSVLGLGLGDMDGSISLVFWGVGADVGGGNVTGGFRKDPDENTIFWSDVLNMT